MTLKVTVPVKVLAKVKIIKKFTTEDNIIYTYEHTNGRKNGTKNAALETLWKTRAFPRGKIFQEKIMKV